MACNDKSNANIEMNATNFEDSDLDSDEDKRVIRPNKRKASAQRNEIDAWLTKRVEMLKKPVELSSAVTDLAIMYGQSADVTKRAVRDHQRDAIQWSRQQDADLVAFAFYYANVASCMRQSETYKRIADNWKCGDPPEPKHLFNRLKQLCSAREVHYLRQLVGVQNFSNDPETTKYLHDAVDRLRAAVLNIEDVYDNGLIKKVKLYVNERPKQRERRPWIKDVRKVKILRKEQPEKSYAYIELDDEESN